MSVGDRMSVGDSMSVGDRTMGFVVIDVLLLLDIIIYFFTRYLLCIPIFRVMNKRLTIANNNR